MHSVLQKMRMAANDRRPFAHLLFWSVQPKSSELPEKQCYNNGSNNQSRESTDEEYPHRVSIFGSWAKLAEGRITRPSC